MAVTVHVEDGAPDIALTIAELLVKMAFAYKLTNGSFLGHETSSLPVGTSATVRESE